MDQQSSNHSFHRQGRAAPQQTGTTGPLQPPAGELSAKILAAAALEDASTIGEAAARSQLRTNFNAAGLSFTGLGAEIAPSAVARPGETPDGAATDAPTHTGPRPVMSGYVADAADRLAQYAQTAETITVSARAGIDLETVDGRLEVLARYTQLAGEERFATSASMAAALVAGALHAGPARLGQLVEVLQAAHTGKPYLQELLTDLATKLQGRRPAFLLSDLAFIQDRLYRILRSKYGATDATPDDATGPTGPRIAPAAAFLRQHPALHDIYGRECRLLFVDTDGAPGHGHAAVLLRLGDKQFAIYDPWPRTLEAGHVHQEPALVERYRVAGYALKHPFTVS